MRSLSYLNKYLFKYKFRLFLGIIFIIISNLFAIIPAQIIRESFNVVKNQLSGEKYVIQSDYLAQLSDGLNLSQILILFAALVVLLAILKGSFTFLTRQTIIIMSRLIEFDLKNEVYRHYQVLSPTFYRTNNTGDIMNRISEDVIKVRMYLGPGIMYTINLAVLFPLVITTMLTIDVKLTIFSLLPLPVLSAIIYYVSNLINKKSEKVQAKLSDISTSAQESFSGIRVIKSYVREQYAISKYKNQSEEYRQLALSLIKVEAIFIPSMMILVGLSTILIIYVGGHEAISGVQNKSVNAIGIGHIAEFVIYVNMLTWPMMALGWVTSLTQRAAASQKRINEFLNVKPEFENSNPVDMELNGDIRFNNVAFTYADSGIQALKNISFEIEQGQSLGIIGRTGSGKSTLVDLLSFGAIPQEGQILFDGKLIDYQQAHSMRSQMGVVPQEAFLFSDTIRENIAFGVSGAKSSDEMVFNAARLADIYDNIMEFPNSFETMVGERGITLSGGQKQRISIARALIRNPKILVLDDCLSAVDTITEKKILTNLKRQMKNRTNIVVSHRVSAVKNANEILVLDKGIIKEQGNHKELLLKKGLYYEMHQQQKLEERENIHID